MRSWSRTGSLYPALYRMERRGWVEAEWGTSELGRRAKLYRITGAGRAQLAAETRDLAAVLRRRLQSAVRDMKRSLRSWLWRVPVDQEVDEELALHLEMRTRELSSAAWIPKRPARVALERLGDVAALKRTCVDLGRKRDRDMRLDAVARRAPRRCEVCVAAAAARAGLHAGRGAHAGAGHRRQQRHLRAGRRHAAAAAAVRASPDRLVTIWETYDGQRRAASPRRRTCSTGTSAAARFERIAGFMPNVGGMVMAGADGNAETVSRQWVTAGIFDVLGVKPIAGRTFLAEDEAQRAPMSWCSARRSGETRFNRDPGIVGSDIRLDGMLFTVVGVVPEGVRDPRTNQHLGDARRSSTCRRARAARTCCRPSGA